MFKNSYAIALRRAIFTLSIILIASEFPEGVLADEAATEESTLTVSEQCEILERIARGLEHNLQAIRTWQGAATVVRSRFSDGAKTAQTLYTANVTFAVDRPAGKSIWTWTSEPQMVRAEGATTQKPPVVPYNSGLVTAQALYRFPYGNPGDNREKKLPMSASIFDPAKEKLRAFSDDFDPVWYFTNRGEDVPARIRFLAKMIESGDRNWRVEKSGDLVSLESFRDGILNRYRFNLKLNGSLVLYLGYDTDGEEAYHWTYEKYEDVWLLASWSQHLVERGRLHAPERPFIISTSDVQFTTTSLNEVVPASIFALSKLGLQSGDIIFDLRTDERKVFSGEEATP